MRYLLSLFVISLVFLSACDLSAVNSPYQQDASEDTILYSSFSLRPKHLDPARSYSANEAIFTGQVYEPPLQYHYLKRPYQLVPLTASQMPTVIYFDAMGQKLDANATAEQVAFSQYEINIKPDIYYQPHPAFAQNNKGEFSYHSLSELALKKIKSLTDFEHTSTRELLAVDYVYQIKRLAHPQIHSPILGLMGEYIVGLNSFAEELQQTTDDIDLRMIEIEGVTLVDDYTYRIKVRGKYPQLLYWLAMPFFAPVPWEAEAFYNQAGLKKKNITLDWYPVGTGPYQLIENDPNRRMVLEKNPNFHSETYPLSGDTGDKESGLLVDAGHELPLVDKIIFTLEKENISYWNKFLQGYYDVSGISSDSFDQAIQVGGSGEFGLSDAMKEKGVQLRTAIGTSTFYIGFNMQDSVVGGQSERARKLRQAISIAIDYEEFISIFTNGRGIAAQGPIPPGIFGYEAGQEGINPISYTWDWNTETSKRRTIEEARQLLLEAGYPNGRDEYTGEPLLLYFDVPASGPDAKANLDWLRKQFQKINIQLVIRSTDYNRFQDKIRSGQAQIFQWGWNADYPDPENFLFLLYGPNSKIESGGENASNYQNSEYDYLFEKMRVMPNTIERQLIIRQMLYLLREDAPWVWGYHPKQFSLFHGWNKNVKPNLMANNTLKYRRIDAAERQRLQAQWNQPVLWPLSLIVLCIFIFLLPAFFMYRKKLYSKN